MAEYDLLVRGATPLPEIGIADGAIAGFTAASAREEIDATGLIMMPGVIDAHVHFNEPGRTEWEGWATGSRAAVAGGVTTVCDMPLNSHPPVVTADAFEAKRRAAEAQSICDFALWGGLIPGHINDLDALAACGAIGFKAFMAGSGIDDFPKVDLDTLREGMRRAAELGLPVAVHAELDPEDRVSGGGRGGTRTGAESVASAAANGDPQAGASDSTIAPAPAGTGTSVADYLASRPVESECAAIRAALEIAQDTRCALHVVHVSSGRGVALIAEARARGVDVTAETCPHYLVFTGDDMERLGAVAKCAPPFRDAAERAALIDHVRAGRVDTIGSDHSPSPWTMKTDANFFRVWGGIAGVQHLLPVLLTEGIACGSSAHGGLAQDGSAHGGTFTPDLIARLTAANVARRFRFPTKGSLAIGCDADLTLIEMGGAHEVTSESLFYRHRVSPYVGRTLRARVRRTLRRGRTVFHDGRITVDGGGKLLTPRMI
jgi:allantoinase